MKNENIIKLEIDNKKKHLEKYLRSQWSWKTYFFIFSLISILTLIIIDLEINFVKLFSDSSKYLVATTRFFKFSKFDLFNDRND